MSTEFIIPLNALLPSAGAALFATFNQGLLATTALQPVSAGGGVSIPNILATGTPSGTTFLRGDGVWATPAGGGSGTVTSVDATTPTGLTVSGNPITVSGTLALTWTAGYQGYTSAEATKLSGITALADPTGTTMAGATAKATPVDADTMPLNDSAASNALKKVTWANIKATLKTYFDTLYAAVVHTHTASQISDASANGRSLITAATYSAMRTLMSLVPGADIQAFSAKLGNIAGLSPTTGDTIVWNGSAYVSQAAAGGSMTVITGNVSANTLTSGTGEDLVYFDITIAAQTISKVTPFFTGGCSSSAANAIAESTGTTGRISKVTAKLTSTTNLRLSTSDANAATNWFIVGRYYLQVSS